MKEAFISAEDKNFYTHHGVDVEGIGRALLVLVEGGRHVQGASTITQQVAKNFLLTNERSFQRKIREALLSLRIEGAYSKEKILELYLNEIYLGLGNYGVAAASLNYFDKSVYELSIAEAAYLAALPKAPNNYNPFTRHERAVDRRNWVIDRMADNGYITRDAAEKAKLEPLAVTPRAPNAYTAGYFAEEVRRELLERYGEKKLYEGGLSVRTTLDPNSQVMARRALVDGLVRYDEAHGFRGPMRHIDIGDDWGIALGAVPALGDVAPWRLAVVLDGGSEGQLHIGLQPQRESSGAVGPERETGYLVPVGLKWAKKPGAPNSLRAGRRRLCRAARRQARPISPAANSRSQRRHRRDGSIHRAACWRWSAASPSINRNSTARRRPGGSRAHPSSPSSMRRRSTMAIRLRPSNSTSRSRSTKVRASVSGSRKISRAVRAVRTRCAMVSNIRSTR